MNYGKGPNWTNFIFLTDNSIETQDLHVPFDFFYLTL